MGITCSARFGEASSKIGRYAAVMLLLCCSAASPLEAQRTTVHGPYLEWRGEGWVVVQMPESQDLERGTLLMVQEPDSLRTIGIVATGEAGQSYVWVRPVCLARAPDGGFYRLRSYQRIRRWTLRGDQHAGHCIARVTATGKGYLKIDRHAADGLRPSDEYALLVAGRPLHVPGQAVLARCAISRDDNDWGSTGTNCALIGSLNRLPQNDTYSTVIALWTGNPNHPLPKQSGEDNPALPPSHVCSPGLRLVACLSGLGALASFTIWAVIASRIQELEGSVESQKSFSGSDYDSGEHLVRLQFIPLGIGVVGAVATVLLWILSDGASQPPVSSIEMRRHATHLRARFRF